jgi:nicotinamide riboside kinase
MTKVINIIGAPGAGKSTIAAHIFSELKWRGLNAELVTEYAKELTWEGRLEELKNQIPVYLEQYNRMSRLRGKVDYIVTDSPLIISYFYGSKHDSGEEFLEGVHKDFNKWDNLTIFLNRTSPYHTEGRSQTSDESDKYSTEMRDMLNKLDIPFTELGTSRSTYIRVLNKLGVE